VTRAALRSLCLSGSPAALARELCRSQKDFLMVPKHLRPLFAGVDDEFLLFALHRRIRKPCDGVRGTCSLAWEGLELIHSDGFEIVLGPNTALAACGRGC
jgi:hypothetical protein